MYLCQLVIWAGLRSKQSVSLSDSENSDREAMYSFNQTTMKRKQRC
jgi:hypothetical protein